VALSPDEQTLYVASVGKSETAPLPEPVPTRSALKAITAYDLHQDGNELRRIPFPAGAANDLAFYCARIMLTRSASRQASAPDPEVHRAVGTPG